MISNYHTHTPRCNHAVGDEREYIENAIKAGFKTLGFSDHSVQFYNDNYISGMRMKPNEAPEYVHKIKSLAEEYKDRIEILCGFEAEYLPDYFPALKNFCVNNDVDYLILGQHFLRNESLNIWISRIGNNSSLFEEYVDTVLEGLSTGCFTYLAHPDIPEFLGEEQFYYKQMKRLCIGAKKLSIPLEINLLGLGDNRHYPSEEFFKIVAEIGNDVILGCDAHNPNVLLNKDIIKKGYDFADKFGLVPLQTAVIKTIK